MNDIEFIEKQEKLLHEIVQKYMNDGFEALPADEPQKLQIGCVFYKNEGKEDAQHEYVSFPLHDIPEEQISYKNIEFDSFEEYYKTYEQKSNLELFCRSDNPKQLKIGFTYLDREDKKIISNYIRISKVKNLESQDLKDKLNKMLSKPTIEEQEEKLQKRLFGEKFSTTEKNEKIYK